MDRHTQETLNQMTARFYRKHAPSFSATRQAPWSGWRRALDAALGALSSPEGEKNAVAGGMPRVSPQEPAPCKQPAHPGADADPGMREKRAGAGDKLAVLDLACGNLRFERFLADALPHRPLRVYAVDAADNLADPSARSAGGTPLPTRVSLSYQHLDMVQALIENRPLAPELNAPACDLAVAFGFMHHVPGASARIALVDALLGKTRPGGSAIASFWQFMDDERLAAKALATTARAQAERGLALDENDYLLGWQDVPGAYRYCHHFPCEEVDALVAHAQRAHGCRLVDRFAADGKTGALNSYIVLQRAASPA